MSEWNDAIEAAARVADGCGCQQNNSCWCELHAQDIRALKRPEPMAGNEPTPAAPGGPLRILPPRGPWIPPDDLAAGAEPKRGRCGTCGESGVRDGDDCRVSRSGHRVPAPTLADSVAAEAKARGPLPDRVFGALADDEPAPSNVSKALAPRSCNRHIDCDKKPASGPGSECCDDEFCEDCFGR